MLLLCNVLSMVPRSIQFWSRALHIYGSYKTHQLRSKINSTKNSSNILSWDQLHEENSKRMMDLCLSLRGFYLKTGFFDIIYHYHSIIIILSLLLRTVSWYKTRLHASTVHREISKIT